MSCSITKNWNKESKQIPNMYKEIEKFIIFCYNYFIIL